MTVPMVGREVIHQRAHPGVVVAADVTEDRVGLPASVTIGIISARRAMPTAESIRSWRMMPSDLPATPEIRAAACES